MEQKKKNNWQGENLDTGPDENSKEKKRIEVELLACYKWETAHFDMWIERSIGGKEFVGLSVKKKKERKGNPPLAREFSFTRLDWSVASLSFLVLFYFILSYCYFFCFRFLPNIHGRQGYLYPCINVFYLFVERQRKDLYMYNELLYFFLFFIIYYYHFGFSLFFFLISHTHYALLYILYIQYFLRQTRQRFSVMQTVPKTDRETLNNV